MLPDALSKFMPHAWWMALHGKPVAKSNSSNSMSALEKSNIPELSQDEKTLQTLLRPNEQLYFFGSFNPVHIGHLTMAREALSHFHTQGFRELVFVPTPNPPNKADSRDYDMLPYEQRLDFLNIAIDDWGAATTFKALPLERYALQCAIPSYTAQTLQRFFQAHLDAFPHQRLHLVMGEETFIGLPTWQSFQWLRRHVHFVVLPRPTHAQGDRAPSFHERLGSSELGKVSQLIEFTHLADVVPMDVNATDVRKNPRLYRHCLPPSISLALEGQGA